MIKRGRFDQWDDGYHKISDERREVAEILSDLSMGDDSKSGISFTEEEIVTLLKSRKWDSLVHEPNVLCELIPSIFDENMSNLGVTLEEWKKCVLKEPELLYLLPEDINHRMEKGAELLGISKEDYIKAALIMPIVFLKSPKDINDRMEKGAELLEVEKEKYVNTTIKKRKAVSVALRSPEDIDTNIEDGAKLLGISKEKYANAALEAPRIFTQLPETINDNVEEAAKLMGFERTKYIDICLRDPALFVRNPITISHNFESLKPLFNFDEDETRDRIERMPALLDYSSARNLIRYILHYKMEEMGLEPKTGMSKPPKERLKKLYEQAGDEEGWKVLEGVLADLEQNERDFKAKLKSEK